MSFQRAILRLNNVDICNIRLISSCETGNGVVGHIDTNGNGKAEMFSSNQITVDIFGNAFYQDEPFYAVNYGRINVLKPKFGIKKNIALFIATVIKQQKYRYSYGRNVIIKLPADSQSKLDWPSTENYIRLFHYKPLIVKNKLGQAHDLNVKNWKKFALIGLFGNCMHGTRITTDDRMEGNIPLITASEFNERSVSS